MMLVLFFILLLVNFFLFSYFNSDNAVLAEQVDRFAQNSGDLQKMAEQTTEREMFLKALGWEGNINKAGLVDELAALLPPGISWKEAAVDPVNPAESRLQKSVAFDDRRIKITGASEKIIPVNEWMARIKTKSWVKNIQLDSYTFNSELNTGQFTVLIDY